MSSQDPSYPYDQARSISSFLPGVRQNCSRSPSNVKHHARNCWCTNFLRLRRNYPRTRARMLAHRRSRTRTHTSWQSATRTCAIIPSFLRALARGYGWTCRRYMSARTFPRCATSVEFARTLLSLSSSISVYETALSGTPYRPLTISPPRISFSTCSLSPLPTRHPHTAMEATGLLHDTLQRIIMCPKSRKNGQVNDLTIE